MPDDDVEAIKRLKARYFRYLDTKRWKEWGETFTEDGVLQNEQQRPEPLVGRSVIVSTVSRNLADLITVHHGHMPEIELHSETEATGVWSMEDHLVGSGSAMGPWAEFHGYGHYFERYSKIDGRWYIAHLRLTRLYVRTVTATELETPSWASRGSAFGVHDDRL
jgi:hypothetical protein